MAQWDRISSKDNTSNLPEKITALLQDITEACGKHGLSIQSMARQGNYIIDTGDAGAARWQLQLTPAPGTVWEETLGDPNGRPYRILFLGNSITRHGLCKYWWEVRGMASSEKNRDYVHLVTAELATRYRVSYNSHNLSSWEVGSHDRAQYLSQADRFLDPMLDCVVVQLGENAIQYSSFESDFVELFEYIRAACPKAKILAVGIFMANAHTAEKERAKRAACEKTGVTYVDLTEFQNEAHQCGLGTSVLGSDGESHIVEHDGVAHHPGDRGMAAIARSILKELP